MIRFLALDLDGTLVPHTLKISERNIAAVKAARDAGVTVTVATGRMHKSALPYVKQLGVEVPVITYNGGLVTELGTGEVLRKVELEKDLTQEMLELCREKGWYVQAYQDDRLLVGKDSEKARKYSHVAGVPFEAIGDDLWKIDKATKLLTIGTDEVEQAEIAEAFHRLFDHRGNIAQSLGTYVEITAPEAEKGKAVAFLCERLGISQDEVMAMGDADNDLGMLKFAKLGVAMGGAREEVKKIANHITGLCEEDGVAQAIEKYILNK